MNGVSIYKDDNHIAASQIGILEDDFKAVVLLEHKPRDMSSLSANRL